MTYLRSAIVTIRGPSTIPPQHPRSPSTRLSVCDYRRMRRAPHSLCCLWPCRSLSAALSSFEQRPASDPDHVGMGPAQAWDALVLSGWIWRVAGGASSGTASRIGHDRSKPRSSKAADRSRRRGRGPDDKTARAVWAWPRAALTLPSDRRSSLGRIDCALRRLVLFDPLPSFRARPRTEIDPRPQ